MKRLATMMLVPLLVFVTACVAIAWGWKQGREEAAAEAEAEMRGMMIFPELYGTLEEEHRTLAERQVEALRLLDLCDSAMNAIKYDNLDALHGLRQEYILRRYVLARDMGTDMGPDMGMDGAE